MKLLLVLLFLLYAPMAFAETYLCQFFLPSAKVNYNNNQWTIIGNKYDASRYLPTQFVVNKRRTTASLKKGDTVLDSYDIYYEDEKRLDISGKTTKGLTVFYGITTIYKDATLPNDKLILTRTENIKPDKVEIEIAECIQIP